MGDPDGENGSVKTDEILAVLKELGLSLSRVLSYAYAGVLTVVILQIFGQGTWITEFVRNSPWFSVFAITVAGAGIYRAHRSLVIPLHHWFGCGLFRLWDTVNHIHSDRESVSPTRWFRSLSNGGVKAGRRILAYNILRHYSKSAEKGTEFMDKRHRDELDLRHAEYGLVVMAAEACFVGAVISWHFHTAGLVAWLLTAIFLWFASYPAPLQEHAIECLRWKAREQQKGDVSKVLRMYGLLPPVQISQNGADESQLSRAQEKTAGAG